MVGLVISCFIDSVIDRVLVASAIWCFWFASWIYAYKLTKDKSIEGRENNDSNN